MLSFTQYNFIQYVFPTIFKSVDIKYIVYVHKKVVWEI